MTYNCLYCLYIFSGTFTGNWVQLGGRSTVNADNTLGYWGMTSLVHVLLPAVLPGVAAHLPAAASIQTCKTS